MISDCFNIVFLGFGCGATITVFGSLLGFVANKSMHFFDNLYR